MLTKNIELISFKKKQNTSKIKAIFQNIKKNFLNKSDRLLMSFSNNYQYSFKTNEIKKYKKCIF